MPALTTTLRPSIHPLMATAQPNNRKNESGAVTGYEAELNHSVSIREWFKPRNLTRRLLLGRRRLLRSDGGMTPNPHEPIPPAHPGIGHRHSSEYLKGFSEGKRAALDAVSDRPEFVRCTCEVCIAHTNAFFLFVDQIYAIAPHVTIEELRDWSERLILQMVREEKSVFASDEEA